MFRIRKDRSTRPTPSRPQGNRPAGIARFDALFQQLADARISYEEAKRLQAAPGELAALSGHLHTLRAEIARVRPVA